ncbi:MAG: tRNA (uridine(54)-C5)-methyltransferase TrmA [Gammaproteobacteria bacterium]|nr:tRNA (uridine(54)-C5)-methyltransferase TrmA [Gammaproteobacteria bacterium]
MNDKSPLDCKQNYKTLLCEKTAKLKQLFSNVTIPEISVFESPEIHFRMRAEFRIWHTGDELNYVMFKKGEKRTPVNIYEFPNASITISQVMSPLLEAIKEHETLSHKLFEIDFLSTTTGKLLVSLIYHKQLDADWEVAANELQAKFGFALVGRARKQKIVLEQDFVIEEMLVDNCLYHYQQVENSFTQPNAYICQKMLSWAAEHTINSKGDLLELYCGNGNFTLPLSKNFDNVLATEVSKTSVKSANYNIALNKINNVKVVRLSSEELTQALNKTREFRRLAEINLENYQFSAVFVDPPRSGLDNETLQFISQFNTIIYISCNPSSLIENIQKLDQHAIERIALFDQFPFTDHIECGVILKSIKSNE